MALEGDERTVTEGAANGGADCGGAGTVVLSFGGGERIGSSG